jgi:hypothetical protein
LEIYGGVKFSYLLYDKSVLKTAGTKRSSTIQTLMIFYTAFISGGYNTINLYAYYGLNPLFKSAVVNGQQVDFKSLQLGLSFLYFITTKASIKVVVH